MYSHEVRVQASRAQFHSLPSSKMGKPGVLKQKGARRRGAWGTSYLTASAKAGAAAPPGGLREDSW
jgi:predicted deacetylase